MVARSTKQWQLIRDASLCVIIIETADDELVVNRRRDSGWDGTVTRIGEREQWVLKNANEEGVLNSRSSVCLSLCLVTPRDDSE